MAGRPWYAFYPDAYERDAGHLSYVEDSAYRRMLDFYYKTGEPLPLDKVEIYRACRAMKREERAAISKILGLFFVIGDDGYHQLRADEEIIKAAELSQKRSEAASKRHANAHAIASANAQQLDTHSTSTSTEEDIRAEKFGPSQPKPKRERKIPIPEDCPTEADRDAAARYWRDRGRDDLCAKLGDEVQAFRAHHAAHGKRMADWSAAWRTWYGNAMRFQAKPKHSGGPTPLGGSVATDMTGWKKRLEMFRDGGRWSTNWGPNPDEPGCLCPAEILARKDAA